MLEGSNRQQTPAARGFFLATDVKVVSRGNRMGHVDRGQRQASTLSKVMVRSVIGGG